MNWRCFFGKHDWDRCVCRHCARVRHKLVVCKCATCGRECHDWTVLLEEPVYGPVPDTSGVKARFGRWDYDTGSIAGESLPVVGYRCYHTCYRCGKKE